MNHPADNLFELGKLYADKGDYITALPKLNEASEIYFSEKSFVKYLDCLNLILRMHSELGEAEKINLIKEKIQDLVLKEGFELNAKTYYILGICATYKRQYENALEYFQKSLGLSLHKDNKEDICNAVLGICYAYNYLKRYNDALKEVYNLQVLLQVIDAPEVKIAATIINGSILENLGKHEQAIEIYWQAYDELKKSKKYSMTVYILFLMGASYLNMGDEHMAKTYLTMAKKAVDSENMVILSRRIEEKMDRLKHNMDDDYDLVFDFENNVVTEKRIGKVDFKNQFILLDLLRLFTQNQGHVYSKEYLVEKVWKQKYDPSVHDNKVYVTIKRLRQMIEPDIEKPKYIFRAKNGYYMNKSAKVLMGMPQH